MFHLQEPFEPRKFKRLQALSGITAVRNGCSVKQLATLPLPLLLLLLLLPPPPCTLMNWKGAAAW